MSPTMPHGDCHELVMRTRYRADAADAPVSGGLRASAASPRRRKTMSARRLAVVASQVLAATLSGGAAVLAQAQSEISPGPDVASPMSGESLPAASPVAASPAASMLTGAAVVPVTVQEVAA